MRKPKSNAPRRKGQAFTLIELLVVVLILAILMAVSMVPYLNAVADSQKKTCRANMQTIANAVQAARVKNNSADYSSVASAISGIAAAYESHVDSHGGRNIDVPDKPILSISRIHDVSWAVNSSSLIPI